MYLLVLSVLLNRLNGLEQNKEKKNEEVEVKALNRYVFPHLSLLSLYKRNVLLSYEKYGHISLKIETALSGYYFV